MRVKVTLALQEFDTVNFNHRGRYFEGVVWKGAVDVIEHGDASRGVMISIPEQCNIVKVSFGAVFCHVDDRGHISRLKREE